MEPELLDLTRFLGRFRQDYDRACNFNRIMHLSLIHAEAYSELGNLTKAKLWYDYSLLYLEAVTADPDLQTRELTELPIEIFLRSNVGPEVKQIIQDYLDR